MRRPRFNPTGNHVDLYGYISMAVGALQIQAREIEELEARLQRLEAGCESKRDAPKH